MCRQLKETRLTPEIRVSTVWLGIDHYIGTSENAPPVLFETMTFGGPRSEEQERYETLADALAGHERHVALARLAGR